MVFIQIIRYMNFRTERIEEFKAILEERNQDAEITLGDIDSSDVILKTSEWVMHTFNVYDWEFFIQDRGLVVQREVEWYKMSLLKPTAQYIVIYDNWTRLMQQADIIKAMIYDVELIVHKGLDAKMEEYLIDEKDFRSIFKIRWEKKSMKKGSEVLWTRCLT